MLHMRLGDQRVLGRDIMQSKHVDEDGRNHWITLPTRAEEFDGERRIVQTTEQRMNLMGASSVRIDVAIEVNCFHTAPQHIMATRLVRPWLPSTKVETIASPWQGPPSTLKHQPPPSLPSAS